MSNVPVVEAVRAAFAFRRKHWRTVAPVLGVVAAAAAVDFAGELSGDRALRTIGTLIGFFATIVAYGALYRLAFLDEQPHEPEMQLGAGGLQWRKLEGRLLGVIGLMFVIGLIALVALTLAAILVSAVLLAGGLVQPISANATPDQVAAAMTPQAWVAVAVLFTGFAIAMIFLVSRLVLAMPATTSRDRIAVFETWALTKGQAARIFAAVVLANTPSIAAGLLMAALVSALSGSGGAVQPPQLPLLAALPLGVVWGAVASFVQLPITVGLAAFLYRGLRPVGER